ncbi:MAG: signal transduction histidine kinase [Oleiphilaceae bacterium]|jgi:signal transduction histidine kinase
MSNKTITSFRANAHLLKLLGDQLIGDDRLAVFELVKNAYDADATIVDVELNLHDGDPHIIVWDRDGHGMNKDTILNKWMEIGTESKRNTNWVRSDLFKRLPLGEKGVGRLAVHKLGSVMEMNTRHKGFPEVQVVIDWPDLIGKANLIEDTKVEVEELSEPKYFNDERHGTRILIRNLNKEEWTRGDVRRLKRLLTSLTSPFNTVSDFQVRLSVPLREKDIVDVLEAQDVLNTALWKYEFSIDGNGDFSFQYNYVPPSLYTKLKDEEEIGNNTKLELLGPKKEELLSRNKGLRYKLLLDQEDLKGIGAIKGSFYVFFRDREILNAQGAYQSITDYLNENTGIRVYRDGIRVFNYGEANDDWLGLNARRVNNPSKRIAVNTVIGNVELQLESSRGLSEKTNREGFDENQEYIRFRWIISSVVEHFQMLHRNSREDLFEAKLAGSKKSKLPKKRFEENVGELRDALKKNGLEKSLGGKLTQIEADFTQMRDVALSSVTGVNLTLIFHEVERGIDQLNEDIKNNVDYSILSKKSEHLAKLLEGFAPLLKKNTRKTFTARDILEGAYEFTEYRFQHHKVVFSCPVLNGEDPNFKIKGPSNLILASINNIFDNSIHWTGLKKEKEVLDGYTPAIKVTILLDFFKEGPAIVIEDNGPGFGIEPNLAVQPFQSTRPGGMGVGLYYVDQVMESIGGKLILTTAENLDLEPTHNGSAVVLVFPKEL